MIEPTETETKESLDAFADALLQIADEAKNNPDILHNAPTKAPFGRFDEVKAAKDLILKTQFLRITGNKVQSGNKTRI